MDDSILLVRGKKQEVWTKVGVEQLDKLKSLRLKDRVARTKKEGKQKACYRQRSNRFERLSTFKETKPFP